MKFLVILASFVVASHASLSQEFLDRFVTKVKGFADECIPEVSASQDDVNLLLSHKIPETHEGKCLIFCFHKKFHFQKDDGSLDRESAMTALDPLKNEDMDIYNKMKQVFTTCAEIPVDSDPCEFAANLANCAVKEGTALGLEELVVVEFE